MRNRNIRAAYRAGRSNRKGKHYRPVGASEQHGKADRFILDRSSSVHKMDRWMNNGSLTRAPPDKRALMRHGWYRRKMRAEKPDQECYW